MIYQICNATAEPILENTVMGTKKNWQRNVKKGIIFENLRKNAQNLEIF